MAPRDSSPFQRSDDATNSRYELAKLVVLGCTLAPLRVVIWASVILPMYLACRVACAWSNVVRPSAFFAEDACLLPDWLGLPRSWVGALGRLMARITLVTLGFWPCIGLQRSGCQPGWASGATMVVANHVSWLDILFFMSEKYQPAFVAKVRLAPECRGRGQYISDECALRFGTGGMD